MVDKIVLNNIASFQNDNTAVVQYNANNAILVTAINNILSRDGTNPNQMGAALDMNSHQILNLPAPTSPTSPVRLQDLSGGLPPTPPTPPLVFVRADSTLTTADIITITADYSL